MQKTTSEVQFEKYCACHAMDLRRVAVSELRTPDYEIYLAGGKIIVEVKEIQRNRSEQESDRLLAVRGYGNGLGDKPGERVRNKIKSGSPQIRARTQGQFPGVVVLYEEHYAADNISGYNILTAMYGLQTIGLAVPMNGPTRTTGEWLGSDKSMAPGQNTSISAIATLSTPYGAATRLIVYHNKYAAIPLAPAWIASYVNAQFELGSSLPGRMEEWVAAV